MRYLLLLLLVGLGSLGCTTETIQGDNSGKLTCIGYCELDVENKQQSIKTTKPDGEIVEESKQSTGMRSGTLND